MFIIYFCFNDDKIDLRYRFTLRPSGINTQLDDVCTSHVFTSARSTVTVIVVVKQALSVEGLIAQKTSSHWSFNLK